MLRSSKCRELTTEGLLLPAQSREHANFQPAERKDPKDLP
jgi:hypothetical protein